MNDEIEFNQIASVKIEITFIDGTKKTFYEDDVANDFDEWLSDINWEYKNELESKHGQD